jgi:serine O-acetyltransferase
VAIGSKAEYRRFLAADLAAHGVANWTWRHRVSPRSRDRIIRWQRSLRRLEYLSAHIDNGARKYVGRLVLAALWRRHERSSSALGFTIPINVFGPGLAIAHFGTITVNTQARVGENCRIHPSTTIAGDERGAPRIGRDAYIGPGARVIGPLWLGDNVVVGANAVVTRSADESDVILAGVPATIIRRGVAQRWRD